MKQTFFTKERLLTYLFFLCACMFFFHTLWSLDFWWHLKGGEYIVTHRAVPQEDSYLFQAGQPWLCGAWLFEIAIYSVYSLGGVCGVVIFKVLLSLMVFVILFFSFSSTLLRNKYSYIWVSVFIFVLLASASRFIVRPELFSYVLISAYLYIIKRSFNQRYLLWTLPFVQMIWVNAHAQFSFGLVIYGCFFIDRLVAALRKQEERNVLMRVIIPVGLLLLGSCFINPYGLKLLLYPFRVISEFYQEPFERLHILEFKPTFSLDKGYFPPLPFLILFMLLLASFLVNRKRSSVYFILLSCCFSALAFKTIRAIAPFSFVAGYIGAEQFAAYMDRSEWGRQKEVMIRKSVSILCLGFLLFAIYDILTAKCIVRQDPTKQVGCGLSKNRYPTGVVDFLVENNLEGGVYNFGFDVGSYLVWATPANIRPIIDGRWQEVLHDKEFLNDFYESLLSLDGLDQFLKKYKLPIIVVNHTRFNRKLLRWIYTNPEWKLVYLDPTFVVFLKNEKQYASVIKKNIIDLASKNNNVNAGKEYLLDELLMKKDSVIHLLLNKRTYPFSSINLGFLYYYWSYYNLAEQEFIDALSVFPRYPYLFLRLGDIYYKRKDYAYAAKLYNKALTVKPARPFKNEKQKLIYQMYFNLSEADRMLGNIDEAIVNLEKAISVKHDYIRAYNNLALLCYGKKQWGKVETLCETILALDPKHEGARTLLEQTKAQQL